MPTELTQEELAAVEAGRKARGVTVPAVEAYKEAISHTEQPKGLDAINISSDGVVETTPGAASSEEIKTTPTNGLKVVPIAEEKSQEVKLDNKIDPNVAPSIDSIYLANAFNNYVNSIYGEDQRIADEKRKKAAKWITAAQMLGDSIGALGNVYWTGKGANAQKFEAGAPKAAAATYQMEQDIRNAREKAAKAKMDATLKKYALEMEKTKADRAQADSDRKHEETVRHNKATEDISRLSAENAAKSANIAMYNAETSRLNAGTAARNASVNEAEEGRKAEQYNKQHGDRKFLIGDQWVNIPKDKWEGVVGSIYNSLPEEVRKVYETQVTDELGIKKETRKAPTIAVMDAAVRQYAQDPAVAEAILKAAGINPEGASAANTKAQTLDSTYVSAPIDATKNAGSMGGYGSAADWVSGAMDNVRKMLSGNGTMDIKDAENKWSGRVIKNKE